MHNQPAAIGLSGGDSCPVRAGADDLNAITGYWPALLSLLIIGRLQRVSHKFLVLLFFLFRKHTTCSVRTRKYNTDCVAENDRLGSSMHDWNKSTSRIRGIRSNASAIGGSNNKSKKVLVLDKQTMQATPIHAIYTGSVTGIIMSSNWISRLFMIFKS